MRFSGKEIEIAREIHDFGLPWMPGVGQYVYDLKGVIEKESPFQQGVYFILDIKHFIRRAGSVDEIKETMCWLPLWEDCREILRGFGVSWETVRYRIEKKGAFAGSFEREVLYEIIYEQLAKSS